jgi:hypothetical protein
MTSPTTPQQWGAPHGAPEVPFTAYPNYAPYIPRTNSLAILALIFGIIQPVVGIIMGHISLSQIRRTGEEGRSLAIAGLAIGYSFLAAGVVFFVVFAGIYVTIIVAAISSSGR